MLLEILTERLQKPSDDGENRTSMWMIYIAVAVDLASDGLMIGTGSAVSSDLALVLAAGQVLADLPEGYATVANFRSKGVPRPNRILLSGSFFIYVVGSARSEEHTSELQSLMRLSYAVFCLKKTNPATVHNNNTHQ